MDDQPLTTLDASSWSLKRRLCAYVSITKILLDGPIMLFDVVLGLLTSQSYVLLVMA